MTRSHFTIPEPVRSPRLVYVYLTIGVVLSVAFFGGYSWDLVRSYVVVVSILNACVSAQVALIYSNLVFPKLPPGAQSATSGPSAYWFGSLGMTVLAAGLVVGNIARSGEAPAAPASPILIALGVTILATWGVVVLRSLHAVSRELDG